MTELGTEAELPQCPDCGYRGKAVRRLSPRIYFGAIPFVLLSLVLVLLFPPSIVAVVALGYWLFIKKTCPQCKSENIRTQPRHRDDASSRDVTPTVAVSLATTAPFFSLALRARARHDDCGARDKLYSFGGGGLTVAATFSERLREWREVVSTAPTAEDPEVLGGRQAEHFLHTLVQSHFNFKGASLYPNKRVPAGYRRREIDLIVVTAKRIHIIEIKNWSGSLRIVGNRWVQTNRNGREIEHPDLVADHQDKNVVLIEYLRRQGVQLDPKVQAKYLSNKVIFMNPRLVVQDRAITNHPDVLLPHRLNSYLNQQRPSGFGELILGSLVQWCLDTESADVVMDGYFGSLTPDKVAGVRAAVDQLGTWDTLQYFGSRVEIGDLIQVSVGGAVVSREQIGGRCICPVRWTRHKTWGLFKALTGVGPLGWLHLPDGARPLSPSDFVFFHRPGEQAPIQIPLLGLNAITVG